MWNNIPAELRALPQWVVWRFEIVEGRQTKVPYQPSGQKASVINPATWVDFNTAVQAATHFHGIGFVLSNSDPFAIIDLDNKPEHPCSPEQLQRHQKIYEAFDSYTELSVSGTGVHIIIKGKLPAGIKRDNVEAYSSSRYMACTGNVIRNSPIQDRQELLNILYTEMQPTQTVELVETESTYDDADIVDMASRASNSAKFNQLCSGNMEGYPSQSEADFALLAIIAFYTRSNEQVKRLFRMSALGKREKAVKNDTYLNFALGKIRAQQPAPMDFSQIAANANAIIEANQANLAALQVSNPAPILSNEPAETFKLPETLPNITLPPGLVGDIAKYFYSTSIRPVAEISMVAAIACMAGIVGRSYNISKQGLAQYLILLARTGTGKEAVSSGISQLFHALNEMNPLLNVNQYLGPSVFASGPAIHRVVSEKPCFVSILGEFGYTVQRLSNPRASSAELTLKQFILDAYGKSGFGQVLQPSAYSDKEKNICPVASPNITILGESTPESFYDGLDQSHIASGFLSRFLTFEYTGDRPDINENFDVPPPIELKQHLTNLITVVATIERNKTICQVEQDKAALSHLKKFNHMVDTKIRGANDAVREIWNRAHLKSLKLAGVVAVGVNPHNPLVTGDIAEWATHIVETDCQAMQKRFAAGDIGVGDSKQINDVRRIVEFYIGGASIGDPRKSGTTPQLHEAKIIPYQYLLRKTYSLAAFKNDKNGSTLALKRTLQTMVDAGMLKLIPKIQLEQAHEYSGDAYSVGKHW